jgi:hypothetical protein
MEHSSVGRVATAEVEERPTRVLRHECRRVGEGRQEYELDELQKPKAIIDHMCNGALT